MISPEELALQSGTSLAEIRQWTNEGLLPGQPGEKPECSGDERPCIWPDCTYLDCPGPCWNELDYADQAAYFAKGGK